MPTNSTCVRFQGYQNLTASLARQLQGFSSQIKSLSRAVELNSTYSSTDRFAGAYLMAVTLRIRLKRFHDLHGKTISITRSKYCPPHFASRIQSLHRGNYAVSTSRHLSKFTDIQSQKEALRRLSREISQMKEFLKCSISIKRFKRLRLTSVTAH